MPTSRSYRNSCRIARALDVIRGAMGPARRARAAPDPATLLRAAAGSAARQLEPARGPAPGTRAPRVISRGPATYELTEQGRKLEPILLALGDWGVDAPEPAPPAALSATSVLIFLQHAARPDPAARRWMPARTRRAGLDAAAGVRTGPGAARRTGDGRRVAARGRRDAQRLLADPGKLASAAADGSVAVVGDLRPSAGSCTRSPSRGPPPSRHGDRRRRLPLMRRVVVIGATGHVGTYLVPGWSGPGTKSWPSAAAVASPTTRARVAVGRAGRRRPRRRGRGRHVRRADRRAAAGSGHRHGLLHPRVRPAAGRRAPAGPPAAAALRNDLGARARGGCRSPRTSRVPRTASTASARPRSRRCCTARRWPAAYLRGAASGHISGPGWPAITPAGNLDPRVWPRLAPGKSLALPDNGLGVLDHVHADDVAQAFERALDRPAAIGSSFHVVAEQAMTMRGLADGVAAWFGREPVLEFVDWPRVRAGGRRRPRGGVAGARRAQHHREHRPRPGGLGLAPRVQLAGRDARGPALARRAREARSGRHTPLSCGNKNSVLSLILHRSTPVITSEADEVPVGGAGFA